VERAHEDRRQQDAEDEGAEPKSHSNDAGHQPLLVGKPLGHGTHRRDIAQADANPSDDAIAHVKEHQALHREGDRSQGIAKAEEQAAGHGQLARSHPSEVDSAPRRRQPETADVQAERPRRSGVGPAELLDQKRLEVAPGIHGAETELQHRAHGRDQPAIGNALLPAHAQDPPPEAQRVIRPSSPTSSVRSSRRLTWEGSGNDACFPLDRECKA